MQEVQQGQQWRLRLQPQLVERRSQLTKPGLTKQMELGRAQVPVPEVLSKVPVPEVVSQVPAEVVSLVSCAIPMALEEGVMAAAQVPAEVVSLVVSLVDCVVPLALEEGVMAAAAASEAALEEGVMAASEKRRSSWFPQRSMS